MKVFIVAVIFACAIFPAFSQDANAPRYRQLSDAMGSAVSNSAEILDDFDLTLTNNDNLVTYTSYRNKYVNLINALQASEDRLNNLIRSNARESLRREERDNYERLLKRLEAVKAEFDDWLKSVQ